MLPDGTYCVRLESGEERVIGIWHDTLSYSRNEYTLPSEVMEQCIRWSGGPTCRGMLHPSAKAFAVTFQYREDSTQEQASGDDIALLAHEYLFHHSTLVLS